MAFVFWLPPELPLLDRKLGSCPDNHVPNKEKKHIVENVLDRFNMFGHLKTGISETSCSNLGPPNPENVPFAPRTSS